MMAAAKRPVFYTGGGVINSGPEASKLLRELVALTGFPITSTLMGLGSYPASGANWLGMLGMHGTYEANHAMHDCDVMINIGARFDDRITGRLDRLLAGFAQDPRRHRPLLHQQDGEGRGRHRRRLHARAARDDRSLEDPQARGRRGCPGAVVALDRQMARAQIAWVPRLDHRHQAAACRAPPARADQTPRDLHHDGGRPAPDVGGAALRLRGAEPLDDVGRPRHDGLRPAGRDRHADGASRRARHRRRRRGLDPHEHAGDVDRSAVQAAGQDLHPQQRVPRHGAPVAGAAAREPLFRELLAGPARLRQAGRRPMARTASACRIPPTSTRRSRR